ncbi:TetR/AcrR family transcriptional regulator [Haloactinopolyspora sp.]|uniref:TetR/AcrR family transcriptional regulator n=1 Tax=Haloactinopolyspora sp. TaxID=1966353 RepID=UPI002637FCF3|nr:TetR/AcrR family transcriptional regulator [Haloactinopolyspora sp.]
MTGVANPKRLPRAVREQQMLDAAVRVFADRGYHGASMDEVAELAGVSKPMVYLYLGSKEDLFGACIRREAARLMERITSAVHDAATIECRLVSGFEAFFGYVAEHKDSWNVLYHRARALGPPFADEVDRARHDIIDAVTGLVDQRGASAGEAGALSHALVGAADALAEWASRTGEPATVTTARLMNLVWIGIERQIDGASWRPASS